MTLPEEPDGLEESENEDSGENPETKGGSL